ncbi:MAG: TIGR02466 family protein [Pseudomonadales bacterium]|nr:TIGR02466 family protein [Pseudomonadales bacterium]
MEIKSQSLFPSYVWSTRFDDYRKFNENLLKAAYALRDKDPAGVSKSNENGWQSNNNLQELDEFRDMNVRIVQMCQRIGESQKFHSNLSYRHQAWVNISPPGASNKLHYHANCHFSGVYYISLQAPECGSIYFRDPRVASRMLSYPSSQPTEFTSDEINLPPEEGRVYIFPGWLEHGVRTNNSDRDRISISFNVFAAAPTTAIG